MLSLFVATFLTMPFDVVVTKIATQAENNATYYKSMAQCFKVVMEHQGPLKLMTSGLAGRFAFLLVNGAVITNCGPDMKSILIDGYSP